MTYISVHDNFAQYINGEFSSGDVLSSQILFIKDTLRAFLSCKKQVP